MKVKTNVRAGQGGASGVGQNSPAGSVDLVSGKATGGGATGGGGGGGGGGKTVVVYYGRCVGI